MGDLIPTSFSTGAVNIQDIIHAHDFAKGPLDCAFAPAFGGQRKEFIFDLEDEGKVMLVGCLKALSRVPAKDKSLNTAMHVVNCVPVVQQAREPRQSLEYFKPEYFQPKGGDDAAVVEEARWWLQRFIGKRNLDNLEVVHDAIARMMSEVGALLGEKEKDRREKYKQEKGNKEKDDKEKDSKYAWALASGSENLLDIGVMQFPDWQKPYQIDLFRLRLYTCWTGGILGECIIQEFEPNPVALENMSPTDRSEAIDMADTIFDYPELVNGFLPSQRP